MRGPGKLWNRSLEAKTGPGWHGEIRRHHIRPDAAMHGVADGAPIDLNGDALDALTADGPSFDQ